MRGGRAVLGQAQGQSVPQEEGFRSGRRVHTGGEPQPFPLLPLRERGEQARLADSLGDPLVGLLPEQVQHPTAVPAIPIEIAAPQEQSGAAIQVPGVRALRLDQPSVGRGERVPTGMTPLELGELTEQAHVAGRVRTASANTASARSQLPSAA